jgi:hypothetical protein
MIKESDLKMFALNNKALSNWKFIKINIKLVITINSIDIGD